MCPMEKIASCQISFIPVDRKDYIEEIDKVIYIIKSSGLEYNIDILSTTLRGERSKILELIEELYCTMDEVCDFIMDIKLSNVCGCLKSFSKS